MHFFKTNFFVVLFVVLCFTPCLAKQKTVPTPYVGKLIDATTQWPVNVYSLSQLSKKITEANISRAGIYINAYTPTKEMVTKSSTELDGNTLFFKGTPKYFHFAEGLTQKKVDELIEEIKKNHYLFVSEIMYRHADKKQGLTNTSGERSIDPLSKESLYLIKKIGVFFPKMPILIHWEFYKWEQDFPVFTKLFTMFPSQIFIINHMGFGNAQQVEALLKNHPNVFFTISKRNEPFSYFKDSKTVQGPALINKGLLDPTWKNLFIKYPDHFLFATDSHKDYMWENYSGTVKIYREILGQLPANISEKIAHTNAETIFQIK